jgi:5-hmdU DNA kinase-like protein
MRSAQVLVRRRRPEPTPVFDTYWRFAAARQEIFFARLAGKAPPWTNDSILIEHRFTNAYRASDRVSQYLIRHVIYGGDPSPREVFFRTLLFKLFNKIDTWELLVRTVGWPTTDAFDPSLYGSVLEAARSNSHTIYSAAYIMPTGGRAGGRKHEMHLELIRQMLRDRLPERIASAASFGEVFASLRAYSSIGDFLAYQLATDLNYAAHLNFSEMEFVAPGPGALDGIAKCFRDLGDFTPAETVRMCAYHQADEFAARGISFRTLWGRPLQLIDCQSLFCEVDKYARVRHPEFAGRSGRTRIKQRFRPTGPLPEPFYPPKWNLRVRGED